METLGWNNLYLGEFENDLNILKFDGPQFVDPEV